MADSIWLVCDPSGRVVGSSAHGREMALLDARNSGDWYMRHENALKAYTEYNGWTITREPLPTPARAEGAGEDAKDAARWRFVRQFLSTDGDVHDPEGMTAKLYEFVTVNEEMLHTKTCRGGVGFTVEQLVDAALPTPARAEGAGEDDPSVLHKCDDWHEDVGPVLWWADGEPPYCGTPLDSDFPHDLDGDHSCLGWSYLVVPAALNTGNTDG